MSDVPDIMYGTAFAFDRSTELVEAALTAGYRGIDTAGSAGAYRENLVGEGITRFLRATSTKREDLYLQTKFSPYKEGKDPKLYPYDVTSDISSQVEQSIQSSLNNLGTDYIDCLVLHSLCSSPEATLKVWQEMEKHVPKLVRSIGMSNTDLASLKMIYEHSKVKPCSVQNRLTEDVEVNPAMPPGVHYPNSPYDSQVRDFCQIHGIKYTPWGVLWSNPSLVEEGAALSEEIGVSKEVVLYACLQSLDASILCGTKQTARMQANLNGLKQVKSFVSSSERKKALWGVHVASIQNIMQWL